MLFCVRAAPLQYRATFPLRHHGASASWPGNGKSTPMPSGSLSLGASIRSTLSSGTRSRSTFHARIRASRFGSFRVRSGASRRSCTSGRSGILRADMSRGSTTSPPLSSKSSCQATLVRAFEVVMVELADIEVYHLYRLRSGRLRHLGSAAGSLVCTGSRHVLVSVEAAGRHPGQLHLCSAGHTPASRAMSGALRACRR